MAAPISAIGCGFLLLAMSVTGSHCSPFSAAAGADAGPTNNDGGGPGAVGDATLTDSAACGFADLQNDPRHCGACNHDCDKGGCAKGRCLPYSITTADPNALPWYVAVDETNVYWTSFVGEYLGAADGKVRMAPKAGGGATTIIANSSQSFDVHTINDFVFFTAVYDLAGSNNGLYWVPKNASSVSRVVFDHALDITTHNGKLYAAGQGGTNGIHAISLAPTVEATPIEPVTGASSMEGIAVDNSSFYWTNHGNDAGSVYRSNLNGTNPKLLADDEPGARRLASDNEAIYWTSSFGDRGVTRLLKATGEKKQILKAGVRFGSIVLDGEYLYATVEAENRIVRIKKVDGSDLVVIAENLGNPTGLAMDNDALYFTNRKSGEVQRIRK